MLKSVILFLLVFMAFSCRSSNEGPITNSMNAHLGLLLGIESEKADPLSEFKAQEKVYKELRKKLSQEEVSLSDMKYFLFIGFVASEKNAAATQQALASDLIPIYENAPLTFLRAIKDASFLTKSACYYLGRHFGFEDKNTEKFKPFIRANETLIRDSLDSSQGDLCITQIEENTLIVD